LLARSPRRSRRLAQVTVYGTIDTGIRNQSKAITATGDESNVRRPGLRTTNRWGLKGFR
jgi:predicted porin